MPVILIFGIFSQEFQTWSKPTGFCSKVTGLLCKSMFTSSLSGRLICVLLTTLAVGRGGYLRTISQASVSGAFRLLLGNAFDSLKVQANVSLIL